MILDPLLIRSHELSIKIHAKLDLTSEIQSDRIRTSHIACQLSVEHWDATRILFGGGYITSAISLHRLQFEALVRSYWLRFAASDEQVGKVAVEQLDLETEQQAKNLPAVADMMKALSSAAPGPAYQDLNGFRDNSWKHLNSYVHAGVHPLYRMDDGYPVRFVEDVIKMTNGLGIMAGKLASDIVGGRFHMKETQSYCYEFRDCMPDFL